MPASGATKRPTFFHFTHVHDFHYLATFIILHLNTVSMVTGASGRERKGRRRVWEGKRKKKGDQDEDNKNGVGTYFW